MSSCRSCRTCCGEERRGERKGEEKAWSPDLQTLRIPLEEVV